MPKYLHFFNNRDEHDDAYDMTNENYGMPWTGTIPKLVKGAPYFVTYNINLNVSQESIELAYTGKTVSVTIECSSTWTAETDSNWITLSPSTGSSGISELSITVQATETDRDGVVNIKSGKGYDKHIEILQRAYSAPPSIIWVDDFPDGTEEGYDDPYDPDYVEYKYGNSDFYDYLDAYLENIDYSFGSNRCVYTDETIEYNGETYYLYELTTPSSQEDEPIFYCLLPESESYNSLYPKSIESDYENRYHPFKYILWLDNNLYMNFERAWDDNYGAPFVLVKVEE